MACAAGNRYGRIVVAQVSRWKGKQSTRYKKCAVRGEEGLESGGCSWKNGFWGKYTSDAFRRKKFCALCTNDSDEWACIGFQRNCEVPRWVDYEQRGRGGATKD